MIMKTDNPGYKSGKSPLELQLSVIEHPRRPGQGSSGPLTLRAVLVNRSSKDQQILHGHMQPCELILVSSYPGAAAFPDIREVARIMNTFDKAALQKSCGYTLLRPGDEHILHNELVRGNPHSGYSIPWCGGASLSTGSGRFMARVMWISQGDYHREKAWKGTLMSNEVEVRLP